LAVAVDTNVVVRLIIADDEEQLEAVHKLLEAQTFYVPLTVLLETHWVLRSRYNLSVEETATALLGLSGLEGVELQNAPWAEWAIERFTEGADFADMLHLAACEDVTGLATFDRKLGRSAGEAVPVPVLTLR
jgi:predicted nucleic-acid-binding protein